MNPKNAEYALRVEGKETDIHDVIIRDVRAVTSLCATIRLLNQYGHKIYNISIDNVMDVSKPVSESKTQKVIRMGEYNYFLGIEENKANHGDMYNISISNVHSRAMSAIHLEMTVKNLHVSNVYVHSDGQYAVTFGQWNVHDVIFMYKPELWDKQKNKILHPDGEETGLVAENVLIENVYYTANSDSEGFLPAVCAVHNSEFKNVVIRNINNDTDCETVHSTDGKIPYGLRVESKPPVNWWLALPRV